MKQIPFNMQEIRTAVKTIKTAILKSRYMAARKANVEHLKLYFRVGAYVSANSRKGTWGTGARRESVDWSCFMPLNGPVCR